ncbi:hypothetical protein BCS86_17895 [Vibrio splendidus]|nr:hypothetical protein BCU01_18275 [Vibrio splendidus]PMP40838.1 hypothetical protein BCS86_17895 [Vibrio splendidus]
MYGVLLKVNGNLVKGDENLVKGGVILANVFLKHVKAAKRGCYMRVCIESVMLIRFVWAL